MTIVLIDGTTFNAEKENRIRAIVQSSPRTFENVRDDEGDFYERVHITNSLISYILEGKVAEHITR